MSDKNRAPITIVYVNYRARYLFAGTGIFNGV